jgi:DNA-binding Lrp family transcriptional regulator
MDDIDKNILELIQDNAALSLVELSRRVGISKTPCWNRIRKMEESGIIERRVTILNREKVGLPIVVFLFVTVGQHSEAWSENFSFLIKRHAEITEVHRLTGAGSDYMLKIVAKSVADYDHFQQKLIGEMTFTNMSSSISLQELKRETRLPLSLGEVG